jgi:hypothetical protein
MGFVIPGLSKVLANEQINALAFDKKLTAGLHSPRASRNHKDDDVGGSVNRWQKFLRQNHDVIL